MTRDQALTEARLAANRAKELAAAADRDLGHPNLKHEIFRFTATSTAYAEVSRAYTALAAVLPAPEATHG